MVLLGIAAMFACQRLVPLGPRIAERVQSGDPSERVGAVFRVRYRGCGHVVTERVEPGPIAPGEYPDAVTTLLPNGGIEVLREVDGVCPEDSPYRFVTIRDGQVVVFMGRKAWEHGPRTVRSDIPVARLSKVDVLRLERGEVVLGDEGVARLLEGLVE